MSIREFFDKDFYETSPSGTPGLGHLFWVPVPFITEVTKILEAERRSPEDTAEVILCVKDATGAHFTRRSKLPVPKVSLGDTEELVVSKAKKRPCVVLAEARVTDLDTIADAAHRAIAQRSLQKPLYLVAPVYSTSTLSDPGTFGPEFVSRIDLMEYPQFFMMPELRGQVAEGVLRLDNIFYCFLSRPCERIEIKVAPQPLGLIHDHLRLMLGETPSKPLREMRALFLT